MSRDSEVELISSEVEDCLGFRHVDAIVGHLGASSRVKVEELERKDACGIGKLVVVELLGVAEIAQVQTCKVQVCVALQEPDVAVELAI